MIGRGIPFDLFQNVRIDSLDGPAKCFEFQRMTYTLYVYKKYSLRLDRPDHASACSLATFACVFFLGPALLSGVLTSIGPADGEAATQEFSIGAGNGKA